MHSLGAYSFGGFSLLVLFRYIMNTNLISAIISIYLLEDLQSVFLSPYVGLGSVRRVKADFITLTEGH